MKLKKAQGSFTPEADKAETDAKTDRGQWKNPAEFILSCLGYAMGLGNVWKFPYTCFSNGGGAYLIPYIIVLTFVGIPTFFLELIMGQYSGKGAVDVWCLAPIFQGVGVGMLLISAMICIFYTVLLAYALFFFAMCFQYQLPWDTCTHPYNTPLCLNQREAAPCKSIGGIWYNQTCYNQTYLELFNENRTYCNETLNNQTVCHDFVYNEKREELKNISMKLVSSTQEFFILGVLDRSPGIDHPNGFKWELVVSLLAMWILCFFVLLKGIKSSGKVVYFTTTFPYLVLTILLIRGALLEGSMLGVKYYMTPDWERLKDGKVWGDACGQIFFALSIGAGGLLTYSSYNRFHGNVYRDMLIVSIANACTDWYAGFVVFCALGHMAFTQNIAVKDVATEGAGLAFIVYPEVLSSLPVPQLWSALFFFMLILLGLDSLTAGVEALITATIDRWTNLRRFKIFVVAFWCILLFLLGLPMCTRAGYYFLDMVAYYSAGWTLVVIGIIEIIVFAWIYGAKKVMAHVKEMVGFRIYYHWWVCWSIISPLALAAVLVLNWIDFKPLSWNKVVAPTWAQALGWLMTLSPLGLIMIFAVIQVVIEFRKPNTQQMSCCRRILKLFRPSSDWGPAYSKQQKPADTTETTTEPQFTVIHSDAVELHDSNIGLHHRNTTSSADHNTQLNGQLHVNSNGGLHVNDIHTSLDQDSYTGHYNDAMDIGEVDTVDTTGERRNDDVSGTVSRNVSFDNPTFTENL